jgi:hypothetical protein
MCAQAGRRGGVDEMTKDMCVCVCVCEVDRGTPPIFESLRTNTFLYVHHQELGTVCAPIRFYKL